MVKPQDLIASAAYKNKFSFIGYLVCVNHFSPPQPQLQSRKRTYNDHDNSFIANDFYVVEEFSEVMLKYYFYEKFSWLVRLEDFKK